MMDMWASSPPTDLLLEIFRRLDASDVVRCACTCKPWRHAIINNASTLRPRPDRFLPDLLVGFVLRYLDAGRSNHLRLPGPWSPAVAGDDDTELADGGAVDLSPPFSAGLLSSRDGFLLLGNRATDHAVDLYLCNPMTGYGMLIPTSTILAADTYVLLTSYDYDYDLDLDPSANNQLGVQIVAVAAEKDDNNGFLTTISYQIFSPDSSNSNACWDQPVNVNLSPSSELNKRVIDQCDISPHSEVVCRGGAIHWLCDTSDDDGRDDDDSRCRTCTLALDVRAGRTWLTPELPQRCWQGAYEIDPHVILATDRNGRLSVVSHLRLRDGSKFFVWELSGDGDSQEWVVQRTIQVPGLLLQLDSFCPRSGCLLLELDKHEVVLDVQKGSAFVIRCLDANERRNGICYPYEMDWSTYLSKMTLFL